MDASRPTVSVVIPFVGSAAELDRLLDGLEALELARGDELVIVDNRPPGSPALAAARLPAGGRLARAERLPGPGHARNRGAEETSGDWLVFIDSDTRPEAQLLDAYFDPEPRAPTGVLAGGILDVARRSTIVSRHDVARQRMSQEMTLRRAGSPYAQTANCAVRRVAFEAVGGFDEQAHGEDADLCFRLREAGWELEERPGARVQHTSREAVRPWLSQQLRHGREAGWLNRRWPGEFPARGARFVGNRTLHLGAHVMAALARGEAEEAAFLALDLARIWAFELGRLAPERPRRWPRRGGGGRALERGEAN
jgi:GT2 family glycosyltransferase